MSGGATGTGGGGEPAVRRGAGPVARGVARSLLDNRHVVPPFPPSLHHVLSGASCFVCGCKFVCRVFVECGLEGCCLGLVASFVFGLDSVDIV